VPKIFFVLWISNDCKTYLTVRPLTLFPSMFEAVIDTAVNC